MIAEKTVVITGSTRGLGRATAEHCLRIGANVVISSERETDVHHALQELGDHPNVAGCVCDVSRLGNMQDLVQFALRRFGQIDVWINNAGTSSPIGAVVDVPLRSGTRVITTNILGVYHGSVLAIRQFQKQGSGRLINIVGRGEKRPVPTANLYASSKAWIRNFTIAMSKENQHPGVSFCAYNPGFIVTQMSTNLRAIRGHEDLAGRIRQVVPVLGGHVEVAARELTALALAEGPIPVTRSRQRLGVLLPLIFKRLILKEKPPIDPERIEVGSIDPET
ncbi:MAG: SDR family oxidoreductase [Gammaproteobacteria bacterium]|nr:SDR family oxidoreductase [Gammaproteobacteria bacterium]